MPETEDQVLVASVHDVRQMATILRGVNIHGRAILEISDAGLHVRVEEAKTLMAIAWVHLSLFDEFRFTPDPEDPTDPPNITIDIPLDDLLQCLNIFGTAISSSSNVLVDRKKKWRQASDDEDDMGGRSKSKRGVVPKGNATIDQFFLPRGERRTGMRMSYAGAGHPLKLILAEDAAGPTTTCEIQTMASEPFVDLPFDPSRKVIYVILQSSWLRDALTELDPSCDKITFIGTPASDPLIDDTGTASRRAVRPRLRLSAKGTVGNSSMDYPNDREVLETFECAMPVKFTYHVAHVKSALRALQSSSKTALRIDDEGLLSLQFMINKIVSIEFRCLPFEDDV